MKSDFVKIQSIPACQCGCGTPDHVSFHSGDTELRFVHAEDVDSVIRRLIKARNKTWGKRGDAEIIERDQ